MRAEEPRGKPDLVDLTEMTERLEVSPATVSRWYRRSTLPEPDLRVDQRALWLWDTVLAWSKRRSRISLKRPTGPRPDIVDVTKIADRLMVDRRTVEVWVHTGSFPRPDYRWENDEYWLWETVEQWSRTSLPRVPLIAASRHPSGPRLLIGATAAAAPPDISPPASTEVTLATRSPDPVVRTGTTANRSPDPVDDIDRIHRYFSEMARTLSVSQQET